MQHGRGAASRLLQDLELDCRPAHRRDAQARHARDRAAGPVVVGREVDVDAGLRHRHHRDAVAGAQAVDEPGGGVHQAAPLSPRHALLVDQDDDEPAGVRVGVGRVAGILGGEVGREGATLGRPQRDELRLEDGARLAVDGHREVRRPQVGNGVAVAVDDGGVHLDELDAAPEGGCLLSRRRHARGDPGDDEHPEPNASTVAHGNPPRLHLLTPTERPATRSRCTRRRPRIARRRRPSGPTTGRPARCPTAARRRRSAE